MSELPRWAVSDAEALTLIPPSGFIKDYIEYTIGCTDAPVIYHFGSILTSLGLCAAAADIKVMPLGGQVGYQDASFIMWSIIVGESGDRKSHAMRRALRLAQRACNTVSERRPCVLPNDGSIEGWTEALSQVPIGLFFRTEFASLLDQSRQSHLQALKSWLLTLWDGDDYIRKTLSGGQIEITRPRVLVLGAVPPSVFKSKTDAGDWNSGYLGRHCFWPGMRPIGHRFATFTADSDIEAKMAAWLREVVCLSSGSIVIETAHTQTIDDWMVEYVEMRRGKVADPFYSHLQRYQEHIVKWAALYCMCRQHAPVKEGEELHVEAVDVEYALKIATLLQRASANLYYTMQTSSEAEEEDSILRVIGSHTEGLTIPELRQQTGLSVRKLDRILLTLESAGVRITNRVADGVGRPPRIVKM